MQLLLPIRLLKRLERLLKKAGRREIGGILMGEHVEGETFRLSDFTAQMSGGTQACFIRRPEEHCRELAKFFAKTRKEYTRYNYIGEWHSHPSFAPLPSPTDSETMQEIAGDPAVGANFVVLLVVKLEGKNNLALSATLFRKDLEPVEMPVKVDAETSKGFRTWFSVLCRR